MNNEAKARIEAIAGSRVTGARPLSGGCISDVFGIELGDGSQRVAKLGDEESGLELEGFMLRYLAEHGAGLPVPEVLHADDGLLLMERLPIGGQIDGHAERHAADLVAALHDVSGPYFGFECDTVIGGLHLPNPPGISWLEFFCDHRLLDMGARAVSSGRMPTSVMNRLERLAGRLSEWIDEPREPSLIHGDMWGGNVLCADGRITGFIDPAIYFADAEIELAFTTLFSTFGDDFFTRYNEHRPLKPGFFEARRDLYNLYPLLVHVRLFGGSYVNSVETTLRRFGC